MTNFCIFGDRCSVYDISANLPGHAPHTVLCEGCRRRAESELNMLRFDYVDLSQLIPKQDGHSEAKISRPKPESSPPIAIYVYALRAEIAYVTAMAARALRAWLGTNPTGRLPVREGFALDTSLRYLTPHIDDLAEMPPVGALWVMDCETEFEASGVQVLLMLGELHSRARRVCGLQAKTLALPGECPSCAAPSLRRSDDNTEMVWCAHCRRRLSSEDYIKSQMLTIVEQMSALDDSSA